MVKSLFRLIRLVWQDWICRDSSCIVPIYIDGGISSELEKLLTPFRLDLIEMLKMRVIPASESAKAKEKALEDVRERLQAARIELGRRIGSIKAFDEQVALILLAGSGFFRNLLILTFLQRVAKVEFWFKRTIPPFFEEKLDYTNVASAITAIPLFLSALKLTGGSLKRIFIPSSIIPTSIIFAFALVVNVSVKVGVSHFYQATRTATINQENGAIEITPRHKGLRDPLLWVSILCVALEICIAAPGAVTLLPITIADNIFYQIGAILFGGSGAIATQLIAYSSGRNALKKSTRWHTRLMEEDLKWSDRHQQIADALALQKTIHELSKEVRLRKRECKVASRQALLVYRSWFRRVNFFLRSQSDRALFQPSESFNGRGLPQDQEQLR
jgi:hypothetical protein